MKKIKFNLIKTADISENYLFRKLRIKEKTLDLKIKLLYSKVCFILGMYPDVNIDIVVVRNNKELGVIYSNVTNTKERPYAFYIHKYKTIYISKENFKLKILAHELGHVITDHYIKEHLIVEIKELLSQYVETKI